MKITLLIFVVVFAMALVAYFLLFPSNAFMIASRPSGGTVTFSRTGISFQAAPDHYPTNGFDHIQPYVFRLLTPTNHFKFLHLFTPDGARGFGFDAKDGVINAGLSVDWRRERQREAAIRLFFSSRGIQPAEDWLAGHGGVPDATRILTYPVTGNSAEVTALAKQILQDLCGVQAPEALNITYGDQ